MKCLLEFFLIVSASAVFTAKAFDLDLFHNTAQRIAEYNYPVETHEVETIDGYLISIFRIPSSPKSSNVSQGDRPVVFLQHGLISSSDCYILNGPDNGLPYLLADAGFDVWLGNTRGNTYGRKNVNISPKERKFWNFSWHEIGTRDLPAMFDYVLNKTNQEQLHYVGHSQGTTCFFVLMSEIPSYNSKIKTAHMLAPIAFMRGAKSPIGLIGELALGIPSIFSDLVASREIFPNSKLNSIWESVACADGSPLQTICSDFLFFLGGWDSTHLNYTLLPLVVETHPAGTSTSSGIHYLQEYVSGDFRQYDHGKIQNKKIYGQDSPPNYNISNIVAPVRFYYGDNDYFATVHNVKKIGRMLPNLVELYNVPVDAWNHFDFLWAIDVKKFINDKVISSALHYEQTKEQ